MIEGDGNSKERKRKSREELERSRRIRTIRPRASSKVVLPAATIVYLNVQKPGVPDYLSVEGRRPGRRRGSRRNFAV